MDRLLKIMILVCTALFMLAVSKPESATTADSFQAPGRGTLASEYEPQGACYEGTQTSGALYRICMPMPRRWNGDLLIYAHGYVSDQEPIDFTEEASLVGIIANLRGYAFATSSYSMNGLAVQAGLADVIDLVDVFTVNEGEPGRVIIVGASEGGLITTLAVEQRPDIFAGGLAMCGPIGDFRDQTDHFIHFRAVFDYFFPGLMPPTPVDIPQSLIDTWDTYYPNTIQPAVEDPGNESQLVQLLNVMAIDFPPADLVTREETVEDLLWYNTFATNDGKVKLGGQPFDNQTWFYTGSDDDAQLNLNVERFTADPAPLAEIEAHYQTTGQLAVPLVTLHTTGDFLVPYWHTTLYRGKVLLADNLALHQNIAIDRYGHCSFNYMTEVLDAFDVLVGMIDNPPPYDPPYRVFMPVVLAGP